MKFDEALEPKEFKFLANQLRREKLFFLFSLAGIVAAALLSAWWIKSHGVDRLHLIVLVLILLQARSNLKLYKVAKILNKYQNSVR